MVLQQPGSRRTRYTRLCCKCQPLGTTNTRESVTSTTPRPPRQRDHPRAGWTDGGHLSSSCPPHPPHTHLSPIRAVSPPETARGYLRVVLREEWGPVRRRGDAHDEHSLDGEEAENATRLRVDRHFPSNIHETARVWEGKNQNKTRRRAGRTRFLSPSSAM